MYKIRIINYQPYEYQLLQELLDHMAQNHYHTNHLSLITIFKKSNEKSHYIVDLFTSTKKSHFDKNIDEQHFIDPYLDKDYKEIYHKKEIYVFKGNAQIDKPTLSQNSISYKNLKRSLLWAITFLFITISFLFLSFTQLEFDTFISYGEMINYISLIALLIGLTYKKITNYFHNHQLKTNPTTHHQSKRRYILFHIYMIIVCFMMIIGLIEDVFNKQDIDLSSHTQITLQDLGYNNPTSLSYYQHASFTIPRSYHYLEISNDEKEILMIKEYNLHSSQKAQQIFLHYSHHPQYFSCDGMTFQGNQKVKDHVILGTLDSKVNTVFMHNEKSVYVVSSNKTLSSQQIKQIILYYIPSLEKYL